MERKLLYYKEDKMVSEVPKGSFINGIVDSEKAFKKNDKGKYGQHNDQWDLKEIILP